MIPFRRHRSIGAPRADAAAANAATANALRASLSTHAGRAPRGEGLPERILAAVADSPGLAGPAPTRHAAQPSHVRRWPRSWALPVTAVTMTAAAAAIVIAVAVAGTGPTAPQPKHHPYQAANGSSGVHLSPHVRTTPTPTPATASPAVAGPLHGVRILDLTFAGADDGWALASAECLGRQGRCVALLRTHDGTHWHPMAGAAFNVPGVNGCAAPCVRDLRFANDRDGYAYGPHAFFLTTDGGHTWRTQPGGAIALESLDGNVIRVSGGTGCSAPCRVGVTVAPIGSSAWKRATFAAPAAPSSPGTGAQLARGGSDAYLLVRAVGGAAGKASLYRSTDDGVTWRRVMQPCPHSGGAYAVAVAAGSAHRAAVLCQERSAPHQAFVALSTNAGSSFFERWGILPEGTTQLAGDPATVLLAASSWMQRSTDGGSDWAPVPGPTGDISFVGFESRRVGRVVTGAGGTIWTTRDGGETWHSITLP